MKVSLVIHGPEVVDSGEAKKVLEKLSCMGTLEAKLGGTMGKTAVLDAGLEKLIDISGHLKPSACIASFFESSDLVCLLNRGKTIETGRIFGTMVASRLEEPEKKPLLQIESPESPGGRLFPLNKRAGEYLEEVSEILGLNIGIPLTQYSTQHSTQHSTQYPTQNSFSQNLVFTEKYPLKGNFRVTRKLSGVFPGENILINGIVIGRALSSEISIISEDGFIVEIEGGEIKEHGLEKLHNYEKRFPIDLINVWAKSGSLRRSDFVSFQAQNPSRTGLTPLCNSSKGKVVLIDHSAEHSFELAVGAQLAVTVGDDTTAIAGDILSRLCIPIIGITDGDCDNLTCQTRFSPGSVVLRLSAGKDDILGKNLKQELFGGKSSVFLGDIFSFKEDVMKLAEPLIEAVFKY